MTINSLKRIILKTSETKSFLPYILFIILCATFAALVGVKLFLLYFAVVALLFSIASLVSIVILNIIDKEKPDKHALMVFILILSLSFLLYYYEYFRLVKLSYKYGLIFGVVITISLRITTITFAIIDKFSRK